MRNRTLTVALLGLFAVGLPSASLAAGGTSIVASKGQPVQPSAAWPEGVEAIVNDPARTDGWNSWFTEWPNDVHQYGFEVKTTADLNRLIEKLAATKGEIRQVFLAPLKEPKGLGWVTSLPEGNNIAAIFSIGDQSRIDEWFKHTGPRFGVMEFVSAPIAVPPTLTIFVRHEAVKLDELVIPDGVSIQAGYVPTVFHRFNTTVEKQREEEAAKKPAPMAKENVDAETQAALDEIAAFLKKRMRAD
jgi:hypothetical protein